MTTALDGVNLEIKKGEFVSYALSAFDTTTGEKLGDLGYAGPLTVEWEDAHMDRAHGAREAAAFVRRLDFPRSTRAFDAAFRER